MTRQEQEIEVDLESRRWARRTKRGDICGKVCQEAMRLMNRKRHPAPDAKTAVEWASVRVLDKLACYEHDTGAVYGR